MSVYSPNKFLSPMPFCHVLDSCVYYICNPVLKYNKIATHGSSLYSGQKKTVNRPKGPKHFSLLRVVHCPDYCKISIQPGQKELSHYHRENFIYNSPDVNFLILALYTSSALQSIMSQMNSKFITHLQLWAPYYQQSMEPVQCQL